MNDRQPIYTNITSTVRTPRCAILINENSEYWMTAANRLIAHASEVWGGQHFLLVPTNGKRIKEKFWEILEAYSPDHIGVYRETGADLEDADADYFGEVRERERRRWQSLGFDGDFEEWFNESAHASPIDEFNISDELKTELLYRLAPFHLHGNPLRVVLSRRNGFDYPFTKVAEIAPFAKTRVDSILVPRALGDSAAKLLFSSLTGVATADYRQQLATKGIPTRELPEDYGVASLLNYLYGDSVRSVFGENDPWSSSDGGVVLTPFGLSLIHLAHYYRVGVHREGEEPFVVILGDTVDDFCLYYSLSRLHEGVCWLPLFWLKECRKATEANRERRRRGEDSIPLEPTQTLASSIVNLAFRKIDYGHHGARIELRSASLSVRQLAQYRRQMATSSYTADSRFRSCVDCVPLERMSTTCALRVLETNNHRNHHSVVFIDGVSVSPFDTPRPKNFTKIALPHHYWLTSFQIEGYGPPSIPSLGSEIVGVIGARAESRVASDGIVYQCPNWIHVGGEDVDVSTVRPKIRMPDEMALLGAYFATAGVTIQYSDKGNYFVDTIDRFGGLTEVGQFIRDPKTRSILDNFMAKRSAPKGDVIYLTNDQRAYLNLNSVVVSLGDEEAAVALVDRLVGRRVLQRGYILQCQRCRLASWYSLDGLTSDFICSRCSFRQQFTP